MTLPPDAGPSSAEPDEQPGGKAAAGAPRKVTRRPRAAQPAAQREAAPTRTTATAPRRAEAEERAGRPAVAADAAPELRARPRPPAPAAATIEVTPQPDPAPDPPPLEPMWSTDQTTKARRRRSRLATAAWVQVALVLGAAVAVGAYEAQMVVTPTYQSTAKLLIDQPGVVPLANSDGEVAKLSQLRYLYADLVATRVIKQPVADSLQTTVEGLPGTIQGVAQPNNFLLFVIAQSHDPVQARALARTAADALSHYVDAQQANQGIEAKLRIVLEDVDPADSAHRTAPSRSRSATVGGVAGFLVFAGTLGLVFLRRRT